MILKYRGKIVQTLKLLVSLIIIFFIVRYIEKDSSVLNNIKIHLNYWVLIFSFFILLLFILNQSFLWYYITVQNKCNIDLQSSIKYRVYSEFGKYVPGKILGYAMLLFAYTKLNQSKVRVSFCMVFELLANILASILVFLFSMFFTDVHDLQKYRLIAIVLLSLFFILIHPKILNYFTAVMFTLFKKEQFKLDISYFKLLKIISLYLGNIMFFGVSFFLFVNSIFTISISYLFFLTGTIAAAGLIGLFAVFVPAGLGVREGILTLALQEIMPLTFAGIISLASRLWLTIGELLLFCMVFIYNLYFKQKIQKDSIDISSTNVSDS